MTVKSAIYAPVNDDPNHISIDKSGHLLITTPHGVINLFVNTEEPATKVVVQAVSEDWQRNPPTDGKRWDMLITPGPHMAWIYCIRVEDLDKPYEKL